MRLLLLFFLTVSTLLSQKVEIEILGSGGPELDGRASSSYILWIDDQARLLVDIGSGSMLGFEKSNAKLKTLEAVVLTHLHIDHSVDLPSFVKAGFFSSRTEGLDIVGPFGNESFPSISEYLMKLFGPDGAYKYMQDVLTPQSDSFQIIPFEVNSNTVLTKKYKTFELQFINVHHGRVPSLALRINVAGKSIVISGDTNNKNKNLNVLSKNADLFIAHHAITSHSGKFAKDLHMEPSQIATIAAQSTVKKIVLSHRMKRTLIYEKESLKIINSVFNGEVIFAEDAMRLRL